MKLETRLKAELEGEVRFDCDKRAEIERVNGAPLPRCLGRDSYRCRIAPPGFLG